jgi:hypothetical protein
MSRDRPVIRRRLAGALALAAGGCITFQPLEPKLLPPPQYQIDVTARVEFVAPLQIGFRCAERGAKFLGLPGINSGACADTYLMTMPDPCLTLTAGAYALGLCEELSQLRREGGLSNGRLREAALPLDSSQRRAAPDYPQTSNAADTRHAARPGAKLSLRPAAYAGHGEVAPASTDVPARGEKATRMTGLGAAGSNGRKNEPRTIAIEFVQPSGLTARCAERGALTGGGEGSAACRVGSLLTVANPCHVAQRSWYTEMLCHEMGHVNGWAANHRGGAVARQGPLPFASESPQALALTAR